MPFICPTEQMWFNRGFAQGRAEGFIQGLIEGIGIVLEARFGAAGLDLLPRAQGIKDTTVLKAIIRVAVTAPTLDAILALLPESVSN